MTKILIVDDKAENLYLLQSMFDTNEFLIIPAKNGAEALGLLKKHMPDLIISDILMPVMDGFTLCRECKKDEMLKHIPFFFYTATYTEPKDEEYALSLGADRFILKPQEPEAFLKIITEFLEDVKKKSIHPKLPIEMDEMVVLKEYNEVLIRKIEDKMLQTEKAEKELRQYAEQLEKEIQVRKEKGESLRKSEEYIRLLVNKSPIGLALCRMDGSLVDVNPAYSKIIGRTIEETLKLSYWDITPEKYASQEAEQLKRLNETGQYGIYEKEYIHKDGHLVPVRMQELIIERDGEKFIWSTAEDISERKKAEIELHKSQHLFKTLASISPVGIFRTDKNGSTTYVNPTWTKISGLKSEKALGDEWLNVVHPEDRSILHEKWIETTRKKTMSIAEYRFLRSNGTIVWVLGNAVPEKDNEGNVIGYVGTITDITERKRLELTQEALVKISNAVISSQDLGAFFQFIFDQLKKIIDINNFYIALYNERTQMISTPFIADQLDEDVKEFPSKKTMTGYVINSKKSMLITKKDFTKLVENGIVDLIGPPSDVWIGVPLIFKENVTGAIVIQSYKDEKKLGREDLKVLEYVAPSISLAIERKKDLQNIKIAYEKAQESDQLKTAFLNNISHEIRTPLNGILGFAPFITEKDVSQEDKEHYLSILDKSCDRLLSTITSYMDISMVVSGSLEIHPKTIHLSSILRDVFAYFQEACIFKNLEFKLNLPSNADDFYIKTDGSLIRKILIHLVDNAVKFTKKGFIELGFCFKSQSGTPEFEFFVKDTGKGISKNTQNFVFDYFRQEDNLNTRAHEGNGLGLSIAKGIVELLGGKIGLESEINVGTTVHFTIPYSELNEQTKVKESDDIQNIFSKIPKKLKILIAEDQENSYEYITLILRDYAKEFLHAETGLEAVEILRKNPDTDLILMDIKMPLMNGYDATRQIRKFNNDIIIIAQTAYGLQGDREMSINAGCDDYITKPIDKNSLLTLILKYLA